MEAFILKSTAILLVLYVFYKILLESTSIHKFKRVYLFLSLILPFAIPFITFTTYVEIEPIIENFATQQQQIIYAEPTQIIETFNLWPVILWTVYGLGVLFFGIKFFGNLFRLIQNMNKNPKRRNRQFTYILLNDSMLPHTFFNFIFLNKKEFESDKIPQEVLLHEQTHATQMHSLDIIFVELLQILFWFNPLFYFIKKSIKLNHEFLADEAVLQAGTILSKYQTILLAFSSNGETPSLANSINFSSIKKRFTVMKTKTSKKAILLRSLLLLPLVSILIFGFSSKETIQKQIEKSISSTEKIQDINIKIIEDSKIQLNGKSTNLAALSTEINKLNTHLTNEQKQKYLYANVEITKDSQKDLAEKISEILYASNIRMWNISNLENEKNEGFKHIPFKSPTSGKSIAEAEIIYRERLEEIDKYKKSISQNSENNPWSIELGETTERDSVTRKIISNKEKTDQQKSHTRFVFNTSKKTNTGLKKAKYSENSNLKGLLPPLKPGLDLTARNVDIVVFEDGTYTVNGVFSTKQNFVKTVNKFHQDISADVRNKIINIHLESKKYIPDAEVKFIYNSLKDYGFYRMVTPNQEIILAKGNTPMESTIGMFPMVNPEETIKELTKKGAEFYSGPHRITPDEALELVKKFRETPIEVNENDPLKPIVILGGC
ncbi:M56 family metallopeptidase [Aequorivita echinoideorum]|uniref:Peptidase M56 domain-containing protein n=1 Tax=Aequorivita echinoideorum TaxID=1549647 RepID=A0ABS5S2W1_9FLAO|nr:M56 family metallopeptidase [Aequorivita echinoideorum]MBT0606795.1 hypothetical protein [Aequorivita echinoideorum]